MAVVPINIARVSQNLKSYNLLETVRSTQLGLFQVQNQLATGLRFVAPSEDALRAARAETLDRRLEELELVKSNLDSANSTLASSETAMQEAINLMIEAQTLVSEAVGDTLSADERSALAVVAESLLDQALAIANREHLGSRIFGGQRVTTSPFELVSNGVLYHGDGTRQQTIVDTDFSQDWYAVSGEEFFQAASRDVQGFVDLDPGLTRETRISDLRGTTGNGVELGRLVVVYDTDQAEIDLSDAATVGDVLDRLNAEMPGPLTAQLDGSGLVVQIATGTPSPSPFTITDVAGGQGARDLGIATEGAVLAVSGADLDPVLTLRSTLTSLKAGNGIQLGGGLVVSNGTLSATISFDGCETVEDVLNQINQADLGVLARISDDGRTLEVTNRIAGADLSIGENGGSDATTLGIRSLYGGTTLATLNDGEGVQTVDGDDFRITTAGGAQIDIDLNDLDIDGITDLQDVINLLNARAGGNFTASLADTGNGIVIRDNTAGSETLHIERLNQSPAIDGLGLNVVATGGPLVGEDVNPIRVSGTFSCMLRLRDALLEDDQRALNAIGTQVDTVLEQMQETLGRVAAQSRSMTDRTTRVESEISATSVLSSDVRDVDITEAIVRFQQLQTALEANLSTASRVLSMTLMDVLL